MSEHGEHEASTGWNADVVRARAIQQAELEAFLERMRTECGEDE